MTFRGVLFVWLTVQARVWGIEINDDPAMESHGSGRAVEFGNDGQRAIDPFSGGYLFDGDIRTFFPDYPDFVGEPTVVNTSLLEYGKPSPPSPKPNLDERWGPFIYIRPRPNEDWIVTKSTIAVRPSYDWEIATVPAPEFFHVVGSETGTKTGKVAVAADQLTVIFTPDTPFSFGGEKVFVEVKPGLQVRSRHDRSAVPMFIKGYEWTFWTGPHNYREKEDHGKSTDHHRHHQAPPAAHSMSVDDMEDRFLASSMGHRSSTPMAQRLVFPDRPKHLTNKSKWAKTYQYYTLPDDYPQININRPAQTGVSKDYLFVASIAHPIHSLHNYMHILDNEADPIYYGKMPGEKNDFFKRWSPRDFHRQDNGMLTHHDSTQGGWYLINANYTRNRILKPGHGMRANGHDLRIRSDNWKLLKANRVRKNIDLTKFGRPDNMTAFDFVVQELDQHDNIVTEWHSWTEMGYPEIFGDTHLTEAEEEKEAIDHIHPNSIDWTPDGNFVMSNRHHNQIIKVHRDTGKIMWRLGGDSGNFKFINDNGFSYQHDARFLKNDRIISLYDNGNLKDPQWSRAVVYLLDEVNWTAKKIWEYRNPEKDIYALAMGNFQTLPNGNRVIGWAGIKDEHNPFFTETDSRGNPLLEFQFVDPYTSYRAMKAPWIGEPSWPPTLRLIHKHQFGSEPMLVYSWNGSTEHTKWTLYAKKGDHGGHGGGEDGKEKNGGWKVLRANRKKKFEHKRIFKKDETFHPYTGCVFYKVEALGKYGQVLGTSDLVKTPKCEK